MIVRFASACSETRCSMYQPIASRGTKRIAPSKLLVKKNSRATTVRGKWPISPQKNNVMKQTVPNRLVIAKRTASLSPDIRNDQQCSPITSSEPNRMATNIGSAKKKFTSCSIGIAPSNRSAKAPSKLPATIAASITRTAAWRTGLVAPSLTSTLPSEKEEWLTAAQLKQGINQHSGMKPRKQCDISVNHTVHRGMIAGAAVTIGASGI